MKENFRDVATFENNEKWNNAIKREKTLYSRNNDIRSEFERDYTRIIHSQAYRRLKHKTQVFFAPENDHICTRIEHVVLVESISYTIAKNLGLNTELTKAIATAHDLGHSPFGHQGEKILSEISQRDIGETFWHEKNGLDLVDKIEILENPNGNLQNLDLTYAVRDGIISHCGEIDENKLKPRNECIDLSDYKTPNQFAPYTWEACVVKIADKISYLGRDIIDGVTLGILDEQLDELYNLLNVSRDKKINNTTIIHDLIYDLCSNSSIENGLCFSDDMFNVVNKLKMFNYQNIYLSEKLENSTDYFKIIINKIYEVLKNSFYDKDKTNEREKVRFLYPDVINDFEIWLKNYWNLERNSNNENEILFDVNDLKSYSKAIIYYISGMTDNYAISTYNKIIRF